MYECTLVKDRDRNHFLFLADQTRCAQTKDLLKIGNYFGHDPRACLQFIPTAYVPRLVRGIQMIPINSKYPHINYSILVF